ncbi:unnamed protein product [Ranitomeya imitator]|uniref:Uncharacterized protein n=1 Tax=Ranitomeya imitator TaxID=111125 RepID=A0ABN9MS74_9NEOB|nr:unnamed protein product [Ranitomeya imitator]
MGHNVAQLKLQVVEQIEQGCRGQSRVKLLKKRESYWIFTLQTLEPKGLNRDYDITVNHPLRLSLGTLCLSSRLDFPSHRHLSNMSSETVFYNAEEATEIVSKVTALGKFLHTSTQELKNGNLERESKRAINLELHTVTIAEYLRVQRISRGIRVPLQPTFLRMIKNIALNSNIY